MKYFSKRFISILLMVCMLLAGVPTQAFAVESANYTLTYTANDDSTVMVTGISVAEGFEEADLAVEIPDAIEGKMVTKIGAGAFMSCQSLTKVMFGEGSTPGFADADSYARNGVFKDCTALTSMKLPAGTTKLGSCMEGLLNATIVIPESVTYIGASAFSFTVKNDENVKVVFSAEGYIDQIFARAAGSTGNWNLGNVELAPLPVSRTVTVSLSDSEGKIFTALMDLRLFSKQAGKL